MNILIEGGNVNPPFAEGTRNIILTYAKELKKQGHHVAIITAQYDKIAKTRHRATEKIDGIHFYRWKNHLSIPFLYKKIVKKEKIDVIHSFAKGLRPPLYTNTVKLFTGKPIVFSLLGWPWTDEGINQTNKRKFLSSLNAFDTVLISSKTITQIVQSIGVSNAQYVPYGIDTAHFTPAQKRTRKTRIACLRTPPITLLKAMKKITDKSKSTVFILSEKNVTQEIERFIVQNNMRNVEIIGYVENIADIYNGIDLFIDIHDDRYITSASPPAMILEAMSCGTSVLSLKHPEINEVINDSVNGFLVKTTDATELYEKIKAILQSKKNVGKESRKTILRDYAVKNVIPQYEQVYKELIS